jgi:hypothetical protein
VVAEVKGSLPVKDGIIDSVFTMRNAILNEIIFFGFLFPELNKSNK